MEDLPLRPLTRILVHGVDSVIGANVAVRLSDRAVVHGLFREHPVSLDGCETSAFRMRDTDDWRRRLLADPPHCMIYCGPLSRGSWDLPQAEVSLADDLRLLGMYLDVARQTHARLIVLLSDAVFAGPRLFHTEDSPAGNCHPFAADQQRVEQSLAGQPQTLIVRTHAYGWSPAGSEPCFAEQIRQALSEGAALRPDPHRHATPILASDLADLLWTAYERRLEGLYHIAGAERTSVYRFVQELAASFALRLEPATDEALPERPEESIPETSLDSRRAQRSLDCPMPMLREGLERFAKQAEDGYRSRLLGRSECSLGIQEDAA